MKQGSAHNTRSGMKVEPKSMAINPGGVSQLGEHVGTAKAVEKMHEGRGYEAPKGGSETHHCGSQGKHR